MNLATSQAHVVTVAHGRTKPSPTELTEAAKAAGFPARELWVTNREERRVVLDVQGLKVLDTAYGESRTSVVVSRIDSCGALKDCIMTRRRVICVSEQFVLSRPVDANTNLSSSGASGVTASQSLQIGRPQSITNTHSTRLFPALVDARHCSAGN